MIAAFLLCSTSLERSFVEKKRRQIRGIYDVNNFIKARCRTCLSTDNLRSIFSDSNVEDKMSCNLKIITGLEIKRDDGLSQNICNKCSTIINLAIQLRSKSKKAERTLLDMLVNESVEEYTISDNVKPNIKKVKVEEDEYPSDVPFDHDFKNSDDSFSKVDVKLNVLYKENPRRFQASRRRHIILPKGPPYQCNICSKEYLLKGSYIAHKRFHTDFCVCELCGKRWRNNVRLLEHKRAMHGLGKIHKCAHCECSFARKASLKVHERRHLGERPYVCDHCGAAFFTRNTLAQHIGVHMPANIQCPLCPKKCKSIRLLSNHKARQHSTKYSYQCPLCPKTFSRNSGVHQHLHGVHREPRSLHTHIEKQPLVWT